MAFAPAIPSSAIITKSCLIALIALGLAACASETVHLKGMREADSTLAPTPT
jgi:hypothetical protein